MDTILQIAAGLPPCGSVSTQQERESPLRILLVTNQAWWKTTRNAEEGMGGLLAAS
jgi:hypothetical protein